MDILLQEDGQLATLEELLAFVDCFSSGTTPDESNITDGMTTSGSRGTERSIAQYPHSTSISNSSSTEIAEHEVIRKRRRKRPAWSSSTGLQRRKRAELQFLREHVRNLEAYVDHLKKNTGLAAESFKDCEDWQEVAFTECMERQKAEETNRFLKAILSNQVQLCETFKCIVEQNVEQ